MTGEKPEQVMLDADAHSFLKENRDLLDSIIEHEVELHLSAFQANEITNGLENCSQEKREEIERKIKLLNDLADPNTTSVDTSGYGEVFGYNFGGGTGEIYETLKQPHDDIGKVDRPDAIGAEAAINRDMPFVTGDKALQKKMEACGYDEYLLAYEDFRELLEAG